jgi:hypothetical protein
VLLALAIAGCHSASAKEVIDNAATFAEKNEAATLHWNVATNGETKLVVEDDAGKVLTKDLTGQVTFKADGAAEPKTVPLELDAKSGIATAKGPDLGGEVTEVRYALFVKDKPLAGTLFVPKKGTAGLVESSKADKSEAKPEAAAAHGGTVQVVDGKTYELVGNSETGETRVYLVGADGKQPKKLKLALESDDPKVVELRWDADGYYVADLGVEKPPRKTELVIVDQDDSVHVCVVGFRPGVVLLVESRPVYWVKRDWGPPGLARGHYKGTIDGPPGQFKGHDDDGDHDHGKVEIKSKGKGGKVHVKVK